MSDMKIPTANALPDLTSAPAQSETEACPMPSQAQSPDDDLLAESLASAATIAIVGASPNDARTSHQIAVWLMENTHLEVFLINPAAGAADILGRGFYESIAELPTPPDIVNVFRRSEFVDSIADEAIAADARMLWLQLGIVNDAAIDRARDAGLVGVQNRCVKIEWARLRDQIDAARDARTQ